MRCFDRWAAELASVRRSITDRESISLDESRALWGRIERPASPYKRYFLAWLTDNDVDVVVIWSMALLDTMPAMLGLERAIAERRASGRPCATVWAGQELCGIVNGRELI